MAVGPINMTCRVLDERGTPVMATVYIVQSPVPVPDIAQVTDQNGRCEMTLPAQGRYRVAARTETGGTAERDVEVIENSITLVLQVGRS